MKKHKGVVKFFNSEKGYGFINVPNYKELFVHQNDVVTDLGRDLVEGDVLEFDVENSARGLQAVQVEVVKAFNVLVDADGDGLNNSSELEVDFKGDPQPGIFIPIKPRSAARVISTFFDDRQIEELTDYLLVR